MDKRVILVVACLVSLPATSGAEDGKPWDPALGTATITGTVKFDGKPPPMRPIDMAGADAKCAELHGGKRPKPETVVVNDNGTLRNVFVWVKAGIEGWSFPPAEGDAALDQKGCMYYPHVQFVRKDQSLSVKTSDPTAHNVHGYGKVNRPFNRSQPPGAADVVVKMNRDEVPPMKVKCDIHPWMNAYIAVVAHPYYAVTGPDGSFKLANLPPGTYTIEAWHEKYEATEQTVKIGDKETQTIEFTYPKKK